MEQPIEELLSFRKEKLFFYSPYNFLKSVDANQQIDSFILPRLNNCKTIDIDLSNEKFVFFFQKLNWDSEYFNLPSVRLFTVLFSEFSDFLNLTRAIKLFIEKLSEEYPKIYLFIDIPAEDIFLIQALNANNFKLVENRLHYFKDGISQFEHERFSVRKAIADDIPILKKTAIQSTNQYDRLHADVFFDNSVADTYLGTYIENCVNGFTDIVIVPNIDGLPTEAFLAIKNEFFLLDNLKIINFARIALTAVLPSCKGWHNKLVCETLQYAKVNKADYVLMTTQATNKAVIHNNQKLGFELIGLTQILAFHLQ